MFSPHLFLMIIFLFQTGLGILGNFFLLSLCILTVLAGHRWRPIDSILAQLTFTNFTLLLSRGIPMTIATLRIKQFLNDWGCKIVLYLQNVSRGLSLSTTCLLSCFQAVTISPNGSLAARLKARASKCVLPSCLLCWLINLLLESDAPRHIRGPSPNSPNHTQLVQLLYCSREPFLADFVIASHLRDAVFVGLMMYTSAYMVILLRKHHWQVQHLHRTSHCSRSSPEIRASRSILLLVSTFLCFYFINSILNLVKRYLRESSFWLHYASIVLMLCFPTISPLVLLSSDARVLGSCCG